MRQLMLGGRGYFIRGWERNIKTYLGSVPKRWSLQTVRLFARNPVLPTQDQELSQNSNMNDHTSGPSSACLPQTPMKTPGEHNPGGYLIMERIVRWVKTPPQSTHTSVECLPINHFTGLGPILWQAHTQGLLHQLAPEHQVANACTSACQGFEVAYIVILSSF